MFGSDQDLTAFPAITVADNPPLLVVQQQQAEQMRIYWKVPELYSYVKVLQLNLTFSFPFLVHRGHAYELWHFTSGSYTNHAEVRSGV